MRPEHSLESAVAAARPALRILFSLFVLILPSCGGGGGASGPAPRFVVATHGSARFHTSDDSSCPRYLDFSIFLEDGGRGWVALEHEEIGSNLVEVTWQQVAGTIQISSGEVLVIGLFVDDPYYRSEVGWRDLSFRVNDEDRDGTSEAGEASVTLLCDELSFHGDDYQDDADFDLGPAVGTSYLYFEKRDGTEPLTPWADTFFMRSTHPILVESLGGVALLVDGVPIPVTVSPLNPQGPLADGILLDPTNPVSFSAEIGLDSGGVTDAAGEPVVVDPFTRDTMDDPGPLTQNPGFETSGGWLNLSTTGSFDEIEAPEGERFAYVGWRELIGYFDVPPGATKLTFKRAVYNYLGCPNGPELSVQSAVHLPSQREIVTPIDCDSCDAWGEIIPWHTSTFDLTGAQGQRVVVRARPASYTACAPDLYPELELDDFRIE